MSSTVRLHEFRSRETLDRHDLVTLTAAYDTFARHGSVELSTLLRKPSQLAVRRVVELPWRDVISALGDEPYLATFTLDPIPGQASVSVPLATALRLVDVRLGGGTAPAYAGHTVASETDLAVLGGIVTPVLERLGESLSRLKEVQASLVAQDSSLQFVQLADPEEMFLMVEFDLTVAADPPMTMIASFPFPMARQLTEAMHSAAAPAEANEELLDESVVLRAPIDVWLEIPPVELTPEQVAQLDVGDVIRLFHPIKQPLDLRAGGVLVARAGHGHAGSKIVCSIVEEVAEDER